MVRRKEVVASEVAEDDFTRMCEVLDLETDDLDAEDAKSFADRKAVIIKSIVSGAVLISEEGLPTVTLKYPIGETTHVTFKAPTGESMVAMGDTKSTNNITKSWKVLQDMTGVPSPIFGKMRAKPDLRLCMAIVDLFLG